MADWWTNAPVAPKQGDDNWWAAAPKADLKPTGPKNVYPDVEEITSSPKPKPGVAADIGKSLASGAAEGAVGIPGFFGDISRGIDYGSSWLLAQGADKLGLLPKGKTAADLIKATQDLNLPRDKFSMPTSSELVGVAKDDLKIPFHEPQTKYGDYAKTVGQFIPGAMLTPGNPAMNALKYGVAPGMASEAAGQATAGTKMEPWARTGAALLVGGGLAMADRPSAANRYVANAAGQTNPAQYQAAETLMREAQARGVTLTPAEAIQQVTQGGTRLGDIQRIVESADPEGRISSALSQRPAQMKTATDAALDTVAPRSANPSFLGPQMQEAGQGALDRVRQAINKLAEPYYKASENVRIPPNEYAQMASLPGYEEALKTVRSTPQLNRYVANLPDDSVGVLNEVKKQLDNAAANSAKAASPTQNMQVASGYSSDARATNQMGRQLSPEYGQALDIQTAGRSRVLAPMEAGPVGQIADTADHVAQGRALMGDRPSPQEVTRAVGNLKGENPQATSGLVREHVGRIADRTVGATDTAGRPDQFGGASFAREMKSGREGENIAAALNALDPSAAQNVSRLVEVLGATGWRPRAGSLTAFNQEALSDMKRGGIPGLAQALSGPLRQAKDTASRVQLGSQINTLADLMLSGPSGIRQIENIARNGTGNSRALARALIAAGQPTVSNTSP